MSSKKIYDPIHGFIPLYSWEEQAINTLPFKRLQAIHQIGAASSVYAGGNHKRYEHSIGTLHMVSQIYDKALQKGESYGLPKVGSEEYYYWKKVVRLAALLHDVGHMPYSHLAEKILLDEKGHEGWTLRILRSEYFTELFKNTDVEAEHVAKISVGPKIYEGTFTPLEFMLSQMLTDDYLGGDRIDYLLRDAYYTGLAYGSFDYQQLLECISIFPHEEQLFLGIEEDGLEATHTLLLARHFMFRRLYHYPKVKSYHFHLCRFIEKYLKDKPFNHSVEQYIRCNDYEILAEINRALFDVNHPLRAEALCIMDQSPRYSVFGIKRNAVKKIIDTLQIPIEALYVEENPLLTHQGSPFLVLEKNGTIFDARQFVQVTAPFPNDSWMYVSPSYTKQVQACLGHGSFHSTSS